MESSFVQLTSVPDYDMLLHVVGTSHKHELLPLYRVLKPHALCQHEAL